MLPAKLRKLIAKSMSTRGPRATIETMRDVAQNQQPDVSKDTTEANLRVAAALTEILRLWPDTHFSEAINLLQDARSALDDLVLQNVHDVPTRIDTAGTEIGNRIDKYLADNFSL